MKRLAIFASGNGSNAEQIMRYFETHPSAGQVVAVLSNNRTAYVLERAENHGVKSFYFPREAFSGHSHQILRVLDEVEADFIVLAGFMLLVPMPVIEKYRGRIVNIHPALLPKFGGKGMYGDNVHKAVIEQREKVSGITIHHVTENYDEGTIIFQASLDVSADDTPETLAHKIHKLEHQHFPRVISEL